MPSGTPGGAPDEPPFEAATVVDIAAVQHRLNNPLTVVISNIEFALESADLTNEVRESLELTRQAAERLRRDIRDLGVMQPPSMSPPPVHSPVATAAADERARVLVVDDNAMVLRSLQRSLRHCDVTALESPVEAFRLVESGARFDVIFSDVTMPEVSGVGFFESIASIDAIQASRIVFLTGGIVAGTCHASPASHWVTLGDIG